MGSIITFGIIGGLLGLAMLNVMALIARNGDKHRDVNTLVSAEDLFPRIDAWAGDSGYRLVQDQGDRRKYQKGRNFLTAPMFLEVAREGDRYRFDSYVEINGLICRGEIALSSGGLLVKLPRAMAKKVQNQLFSSLGAPMLA
ncbi:hypothetical protein [Luteimonas aquatica]|uniref:hypothetical protein n=1 Tax=Luteimonas aquatica TaxID=450364 RepID=UPI001F59FF3B|nr:hypothetical protein [Luteimonas aquatica]